MYFEDEFLRSLPEESNAGILAICNEFIQAWNTKDIGAEELVLKTLALISTYSETNNLNILVPKITTYNSEVAKETHAFVLQLKKDFEPVVFSNKFEEYKSLFATKLGTTFHYEFSEGDLGLIQKLINNLRELISTTEELGEDHRNRLIKKLEKFQFELHKRISDLDRFWGFCIDASLVAGLMGENAKPMFDLVKKIVDIIWPTQTRAYELPSSFPFKLIGQSEDDKS